MADESVSDPGALVEIIRREAADLVKLKVMKQGGLLRTLEMVACAAAAGLRVVLGHGFGLMLSTLAEAAVAAVSDAVIDGCEAVGPLKMAGDVVVDPVPLEAGVIRLPDAPGLGASIDAGARSLPGVSTAHHRFGPRCTAPASRPSRSHLVQLGVSVERADDLARHRNFLAGGQGLGLGAVWPPRAGRSWCACRSSA